jgi:hypothetical protein
MAGDSIFLQKFLDDALDLAIIVLAEVVIANSSFLIDEVLRRPVFVLEGLPNPVVAVDGDWVRNLKKSVLNAWVHRANSLRSSLFLTIGFRCL